MKFLPDIKDVWKIAATGKYKVLPVSCEILSDICTPIEAMRILKNVSTHCYMLESVAGNEKWGRYTFMGFDPKLEITCADGEMKAGNIKFKPITPLHTCTKSWPITKAPVLTNFPLSQAVWQDILPTITRVIVNRLSGRMCRTAKHSRTWT